MITCIELLDVFLQPLRREWILEFYGDREITQKLMHRVAACLSRYGDTYLYINQLFGGLNPYMLRRIARTIVNADLDRIYVSRGLRLEDFLKLSIRHCRGFDSVVVVDPYLHTDPAKGFLTQYTLVTSAIRRLSSQARVVVFNRVSRAGSYMPEGGSFHHHTVHVIVRSYLRGRSSCFELIKHPAKDRGELCIDEKIIVEGDPVWVGQHQLLEWALRRR